MTEKEKLIKAMEYSEKKLKEVDRNKLDEYGSRALDAFLKTFSEHIGKLKAQA